jgi:hypothetical protein
MKRRGMLLLIAASVAAVWVLTAGGCVHSVGPPSGSGTGKTAAALGKSEWPILGENQPVLGVDLYALSNYPASEVKADGKRMLAYIKNVLRADAVGIVWNFYTPSPSSVTVQATKDTLSASNVAILTKLAGKYGLQVQYRPLIFVTSGSDPWEGKIIPSLQPSWFRNYYRAELPYLKIAQQLRVREFVTGTELAQLNNSPLWSPFFARVSRVYHGTISYSAWDGNYFGADPGAQFQAAAPELPPVKYVGMDMYWHTHIRPAATSSEVTAAWKALFGKVSPALLRRTAIDEIGIPARVGAYLDPQNLGRRGRLSEQVQANWFTAACATVHRYHMRGVFFFKVDLTDRPAHPATSLSTFEGRRGAAAISNCARILH